MMFVCYATQLMPQDGNAAAAVMDVDPSPDLPAVPAYGALAAGARAAHAQVTSNSSL